MERKLQRVTIDLPVELHEKMKLLAVASKKSMKDVLIDAISILVDTKSSKTEIKNLRHQLHRLKYDMHKGE